MPNPSAMPSTYPAQHIRRSKPANVQEQDAAFFHLNEYIELAPSRVLRLQNVSLLADGVVFRDLRPYAQTFVGEKFKTHNWRGLLAIYTRLPKVQLPPNKVYILAHDGWANNYYHWLVDTLPRLVLVKDELATGVLLLPEHFTAPFIIETLRVLGAKNILRIKEQTRYKAAQLLVPLRLAPVAHYRPPAMQELAAYLRHQFAQPTGVQFGDKIYISRAKATRRKIINEEEVIALFRRKGFAVICFEDYTFQEQVSIAAHAQYLVSIHGAGLTNMLFMPKNSSVLELQMKDDGTNCYYYTLADALGLRYYYQFCTPNDPALSVQDADLWVDTAELEKNVRQMLQA